MARLRPQPTAERHEAPAEGSPTPWQRVKSAGRAVVSKIKSKRLQFRLYPILVRLGGLVSRHPTPELQAEQLKLETVEAALSAAKASRARNAAIDTGLKLHAGRVWQDIRAGAKKARNWMRALADGGAARWRKRVAGTRWERIKRRHVLIGSAGVLAASFAVWACIEYWPIDENNPVAVARQADRLAAHPGDPTKPAGIAGVADAKLMSSGKNARALDICMKAVAFYPEEPRHLFELGRVLLLAGEADEAREFLGEAAVLGHVGARAYLGRLETDPQKALEIFRKAAADGFSPAAQMAAETDTYINFVFREAGRKADELAADPSDPTKPKNVKGIPDAALASETALESAINACTDAVAAFPDEPRYHFELGRALFIAGADEAVEHLALAAEKEHGAALAYLARLQDDAMTASDYLRRAVKAGYIPATQMLTELEAQVGPDFEGDGYHFGDILRALYDKNIQFLNEERFQNLHYAELINAAFKTHAKEIHDASLTGAFASQYESLHRESNRPASARDIANLLMFQNAQNPLSRPALTAPEADAQSNVEKDIARLISAYGKSGDAPKHIAEGIRAFVR